MPSRWRSTCSGRSGRAPEPRLPRPREKRLPAGRRAGRGVAGRVRKRRFQGRRTVAVAPTDAGCSPSHLRVPAGPTTFAVTNNGSGKATEFEVLQGSRILGEKENVTEGLSGSLSLDLPPARYAIWCGAGTPKGVLEVTGKASSAPADPRLTPAVRGYDRYVRTQVADLQVRAHAFTDAVRAGDVATAKRLYGPARVSYERIEPVAESFGSLDPAIDARANDIGPRQRWTGFHRIEQALWVRGTARGMAPYADRLDEDIRTLEQKVDAASYQPAQLAN